MFSGKEERRAGSGSGNRKSTCTCSGFQLFTRVMNSQFLVFREEYSEKNVYSECLASLVNHKKE